MCGIAGFVGNDIDTIKRMCNVIAYRGPDDSGYYVDDLVSLGHNRLSIIDLSEKGKQPIHNEDESVWITYNGEIYNYRGLRGELEKRGHHFYTNTDTETIVHAYEEYGEECVQRLRGMFAFALWDSEKKRMLLARDRLGIKPLHYYLDDERLIFGSEIKSILRCGVPRALDYNALHSYPAYRFVLGESTAFKGIKRLSPGHVLLWSEEGIEIKKYWDLEMTPGNLEEDYYQKKISNLFEDSVRIRLMSEVPLGAYLSGGIDSSSVVAVMSSLLEEPVKTFSVGFGDSDFDEVEYARCIAEHFSTEHHEFIVEPKAMELFPKILWHYEEPIADPALFPVYLLSEQAKKYVTVVLTGEGGDELFAGYEQYKIMTLAERYGSLIPRFAKTHLLPWMANKAPKSVLDAFFKYSSSLGDEGIKRFAQYMACLGNKGVEYLTLISVFNEDEEDRLYTNETRKRISRKLSTELNKNYFRRYMKGELLNRLIYLEIKTSLPDHLLMKVDKMTMAHSIEARVPLLDHVLAEFSATMPQEVKLRGTRDKYIFRKAMSGMLPKKILQREKQRFFVPIHKWLGDESRELTLQILDSNSIKRRGYFNYTPIRRMFEKFEKSKLYYSRQLWSLLSL
ncbi:MAG: asparagine synthase (glutamine-hydrolyzing), partial [Candidatus Hydrothermarchaeota archaeon]|nr:asparagine synthase (glutamine-hydrolyzing) [Candidatus Hydrothermarchaeota archaeon]